MIEPAIVVAVVLGVFHTALYVAVRGRTGARLPLLVLAAVLGAWAGDAIGRRFGIDLLRLGDVRLVSASAVAWVGIGLAELVAVLGPDRSRA
jgi:hypothetical protein